MKKAQAIITDLLVAVSIGIVLLISINLSWDYYTLKLSDDVTYSDMFIRASETSEVLVSTQGYPKNWNSNNVILAGLADYDRKISESKLSNFAALNNSAIKDMFKVNLYNFTFEMKYKINDSNITSIGEAGNANVSVNSRRLVIYRNEPAIVNFIVWK
ncbi:MAG TPA: hypothetical protein VJB94_04370 [Candidatus Nanoarchaeia archaeon]|nr:hypothetical protein [Candidatus Nanoarchaeia archaeon]